MSKITYEDKRNILAILDRNTQATAEDFNEIKKSVNKLYDLIGAGNTLDLFEGDPIDGSWRILGDYQSDTIKFQRWSATTNEFVTVYQAGQSIESDAFVLDSIGGQIKFKAVKEGKQIVRSLIRPSVSSKDSVVVGNGSGHVGLFAETVIQASNIQEDVHIKIYEEISGTSSETTIGVNKGVFEFGIAPAEFTMFLKSVTFDAITDAEKIRFWAEDIDGNIMFETCSLRDFEKGSGNSKPLYIGLNTYDIVSSVTILPGTMINYKLSVSENVVFQAGHDSYRNIRIPTIIFNINSFEVSKIMSIKNPSFIQVEGSTEIQTTHGNMALKPLCRCDNTLFNRCITQNITNEAVYSDPTYDYTDGSDTLTYNSNETETKTFSTGVLRYEMKIPIDDPRRSDDGHMNSIKVKLSETGMYSIDVYVKNYYKDTTYDSVDNIVLQSGIFRLKSLNGKIDDIIYFDVSAVDGVLTIPLDNAYEKFSIGHEFYIQIKKHDQSPLTIAGSIVGVKEDGSENFMPITSISYTRIKNKVLNGIKKFSFDDIYNRDEEVFYNNKRFMCLIDGTTSANPETNTTRWIESTITAEDIQKIKGSIDTIYLVSETGTYPENAPLQLSDSVTYAVDATKYNGTTYFKSPIDPISGTTFLIWDINGNFLSSPVAVSFNKYNGVDNTGVLCNINSKIYEFTYINNDYGWYLKGE